MRFRSSPDTVGVEYELLLVDADTLELVDRALPIVERFGGDEHVKPEHIQSTIEVTTPVCERVEQVDRTLRKRLRAVREVCGEFGVRAVGAGTHPSCQRLATITPLPRYLGMAEHTGLVGRMQITTALQVHVGVTSGQEALAAMNELRSYLPLLLALSASSPFWMSHETGFASFRQRLMAMGRTNGMPPHFSRWSEVEDLFFVGERAGSLSGWRDVHWDLRPRPDYGTIEIRTMDTAATASEASVLAAFARALTTYLLRTPPRSRPSALMRPLPSWLERHNEFQASRLALDAECVADTDGRVVRLRELLAIVLEEVGPIAEALGDGEFLRSLPSRFVETPNHTRQRLVRDRTGSMREVVGALARELDADLGM